MVGSPVRDAMILFTIGASGCGTNAVATNPGEDWPGLPKTPQDEPGSVCGVLAAIPVVGYARENHLLAEERMRVKALVHVGHRVSDAEASIRRNGYEIYGDAPTRYLGYQQVLVIIGDTNPSVLGTICYAAGSANPLRTHSPCVAISATLNGDVTKVECLASVVRSSCGTARRSGATEGSGWCSGSAGLGVAMGQAEEERGSWL